eukprot:scaffold1319_cov126-Cylindrotheca_fusiformis.AAC.1
MQDDDLLSKNGIPMFGASGMVLRKEQREEIARRKGQCTTCGAKTHTIRMLRKTPLTTSDAWKGFCIRCEPSLVPNDVLAEYQKRKTQNERQHHTSFQAAANAARFIQPNRTQVGGRSGPGTTMSPTLKRSTVQPMARTGRQTSGGRRPRPHSPNPRNQNDVVGGDTYRTDKSEWKSIAKDLSKNLEKPDVCKAKLHALRNLAEDRNGALKEVKAVMEKHHVDIRLVTIGIGAIWSVGANNEEKKKEILDGGFVDIVLDVLRKPAKVDSSVAEWTLGAISSLAFHDDVRNEISDKDGIKSIIDVLDKHPTKPIVFEWACRAMVSFVDVGDPKLIMFLERNMGTIENMNGIQIVGSAMKNHGKESIAQFWALRLMFRLLDRSDSDMLRALTIMNDADIGISCIKILSNPSVPEELFGHAAELLKLLLIESNNPAFKQASADCIPAVMNIMGDSGSNIPLVESCARVLHMIGSKDRRAKARISGGATGLLGLLSVMSEQPANLELAIAGMRLFWMLSSDRASFDFGLPERICKTIKKVLQRHPDDVQFKTAACGFLANIINGSSNAPNGIVPEDVLELTENAAGDPMLEKQAKKASAAVYMKFPNFAENMLNNGLSSRLLEGLCDSANVDIQLSSATTLANMISTSEIAHRHFFEGAAIETATAALLTTTSETLAEQLLYLLSAMITGGAKNHVQLASDFVQCILQVMDTFSTLDKVACTVIRNTMLVLSPGINTMNCDGVCQMLASVMSSQSSNNDLLEEACLAIWATMRKQGHAVVAGDVALVYQAILGLCAKQRDLGADFNSGLLFVVGGALTAVLDCMSDNPGHITDDDIDLIINMLDLVIEYDVDNISLMEKMLEVTHSLCVLKKDIIVQFGVIVVVIDCMVEHEGNERIQGKGCAILALLASTENLQVNLSIAETDGIDMLVSALATFSHNLDIQIDTCKAMSHLSMDQESRMLISSQGGPMLLVNAMNNHKDSIPLLECACGALLNLSADAEEQLLANSNVVEVVIRVMSQQLTAPRLQEKALGVLQNVSMRSRDAKRAIANAGGIGAIVFSMKEFMGTAGVLERAFTTLWSLCVLEDNQEIVANEGGLGLIINGMMANITFEKVQKQGCGCLATISSNSRNKSMIRDLGGLDAIVYAMWAHFDSQSFLVEGCRALSALAVNVQTNEVMICTESEISAILAAMKRFPLAEKLQEHSCVALRNFSLSPDNLKKMRTHSDEIINLMDGAAQRFPSTCGGRARQVIASLQS